MTCWGVVPAAGAGSRIQPLAFSKELLPVGSRSEGGNERPRAVSEYPIERMVKAGADRICVVISPGKSDIVEYFGAETMGAQLFYAVQPEPVGLCDALFRALPLVRPEDRALVGLPDTVWFPDDGLAALDERQPLSFLYFPVEHPELFDAVVASPDGRVREVQVKRRDAASRWVWGAFALSGLAFAQLHALGQRRERRDEHVGTLVNAWLAEGGEAWAVPAGETYVDVGTLHGYRAAIHALERRSAARRRLAMAGREPMIEAVMLWTEPNNKSHWDFTVDPDWRLFAGMTRLAVAAIRSVDPALPCVLGGISPIDAQFIANMTGQGVIDAVDVVAVHGFPLDWNHWQVHEWPDRIAEIEAVTSRPVWVSEVGVSSFGAKEVREWGLRRTCELLLPPRGRRTNGADVSAATGAARALPPRRVHWYSLLDLPRAWPATTRHREAEGSAYYRHFYMGPVREDGTPKRAWRELARHTPEFGICQWFHFQDHRLDDAVLRMQDAGVRYLRTGLSWADSYRPGWEAWFDRQMQALEPIATTVTFCFTPEERGLQPHHTSPPRHPEELAEFCARMVRRYAPAARVEAASPLPRPAPGAARSVER